MLQEAYNVLPFCFLKLMLKVKFSIESFNSDLEGRNINLTQVAVSIDAPTKGIPITLEQSRPLELLCVTS